MWYGGAAAPFGDPHYGNIPNGPAMMRRSSARGSQAASVEDDSSTLENRVWHV